MFDNNGSFLLVLFEFFLFFAWFMCLWWILGDIFRSKDIGGVVKTLWVLFVILIPWLGILVYMIARGNGMHERQLEQVKAMQRGPRRLRPIGNGQILQERRGRDRVGQGSAGQWCHHPGRVRTAQGEGPRSLISLRSVEQVQSAGRPAAGGSPSRLSCRSGRWHAAAGGDAGSVPAGGGGYRSVRRRTYPCMWSTKAR